MATISKDSFSFLKKLEKNNDRDWFQENKGEYEKQHAGVIAFADQLLGLMNEHDTIETISGKKSLYKSIEMFVFQKIKRLTKQIGAVALKEQPNNYAVVTTFIFNLEETRLLVVDFGVQIKRTFNAFVRRLPQTLLKCAKS